MLLQPERIGGVITKMVAAVKKPVTVKIRAGWDESSLCAVEVTKIAEEAGASAIAIHGRTRKNAYLFDWVNGFNWKEDLKNWDESQDEYSFIDKNGNTHKFQFINNAPLNETHEDFKVNFLEYWEINSEGKILYHNTWITDLTINQENCYQIAQGGRVRWHIENETFNTLKNQGYNFEHNYGHGYKHLSTVFAMLMMLAFLIDQSEQLCCGLSQTALEKLGSKKSRLWREIRHFFDGYIIPSWEVLYEAIINEGIRKVPILDSS